MLGKQFDSQLIHEHSAQAAAQTNPDYRYAYLPDDVDLSNPTKNDFYKQAVVLSPGLGVPGAAATVSGPAQPANRKSRRWAQVPTELQSLLKSGDPLAS